MFKRIVVTILFLFAWVTFPPGACLADEPSLSEEVWLKKHADKPSVTLLDTYRVELKKNGSYTEYIHAIERIQNERAMHLGEIPIVYDKKHQKVRKIKAFIRTPDGKRHRYKKLQDISTSKEAYYSDTRKKIITMPNVVPGSVIDCQYEKFNKQSPVKGEYFNLVGLFDTAPLKYQVISLTVPQDLKLYFKNIRTDIQPEVIRKKGKIIYKWESKDDEAYDEDLAQEDYTPPYIEFMPYTCISTMKDWSQLSDWAWELYSKNIISSDEIKAEVKRITKDKKTHPAKIDAITKYLQDNFRYVRMMLDEHNMEPHPASEVFANKFGDCKDQTILLITMLKEIAIVAYPALIRNHLRGDISNFLPDPGYFSHVVAAVKLDGKLHFLDPLIKGYQFGEQPLALEGDYAFLITDRGGEFIQLPFMDLNQKTEIINKNVHLKEDGSAILDTKTTMDRQKSIETRKFFKLATKQAMEDYMDYLESLTEGGRIIEHEIEGKDDEYGFLSIKVKSENPNYIRPYGRIMIFGHTSSDLSSLFYRKTRKYPLYLPVEFERRSITEFIIPEGFKFEYIPKNANFKSDFADVSVSYQRKGKNIKQEKRWHYKRTKIAPEKYQELKDLLRKIDTELNECIIIRKVK